MRAPDKPIARISKSGEGIDAAASRAFWYVIYEGPQSVFVDDGGQMFALPQGCALMLRWIDAHRAWWVGNFTTQRNQSLRALILVNLHARLRELQGVPA
jgi:hypothetical protein